jgi:hypothetical protein
MTRSEIHDAQATSKAASQTCHETLHRYSTTNEYESQAHAKNPREIS